ncbi:hypothetical protein ACFPK1_16535 [Actinomycetospora rhizophila]|uniref:STAS domain-containing protein n=1 Tax=Actinomycetospora rhizophila TaxID=1416876 RepID=A0ABV9ZGJ8_9PSEU
MYDGDVLIVFENDLDVAPHVRACVEEVRAAGTRIVVEQGRPDGAASTPCRLHLGGTLSFFTDAGAALVIASASDPCEGVFRLDLAPLDFLGLRGCAALLRGTRRLREHGGVLLIEHPRVPVRRVLHRGLVGARNVSVD